MKFYDEISVNVIGRNGIIEEYSFNRSQIAYYRGYTETPSVVGEKNKLITMVYLVGSPKGLRIECSYDQFKNKISSKSLDLSRLNANQFNEVKKLVSSLEIS